MIFQQMESQVRSYCRSFPAVFSQARGSYLYDEKNRPYLDFLSGAGSLNYGHNNPLIKKALIDYIEADGVTHGLDLHTDAKKLFLEALEHFILQPRDLNYRVQFTGPTGANSVEAALKLARKIKKRSSVIAFTNGFHGVSLGALALTGNEHHRMGSGVPLHNVERMPFCGYFGKDIDTIKMMDKLLSDPSSGVDLPAAAIVEIVQGEGGLNLASDQWLQSLEKLCRKHDILLIVDDIQAGCGRTGTFFSFESSNIKPDMVTLSKSLSGYGLPLSIVLFKPELDIWAPGEHNGTFRGNNHAFITAATALQLYWSDKKFEQEIQRKGHLINSALRNIQDKNKFLVAGIKGKGMMQGIECHSGDIANQVCQHAFERGLIIETAGNRGQVVKCFCPLTISESDLRQGMEILEMSFAAVKAVQATPKSA